MFLTPAYLIALSLGAIPILIHLMRRKRILVVHWAAWQFLVQSTQKNRKRLRLEQLILLLIRILIILLVVFALARPTIQATRMGILAGNAQLEAVIVLDNSLSMEFKKNSRTDFETARLAAITLISQSLRQGDRVSVLLTSPEPHWLIEEPLLDLQRAKNTLQSAISSGGSVDLGRTIGILESHLTRSKASAKEVYWFSDNQKSMFESGGQEALKSAWKKLEAAGRITWLQVGGGIRDNLSVGAPVLGRDIVTPRTPVRIESTIHNNSTLEVKEVPVELMVDGKSAGETRVTVGAGKSVKATFLHLFERPGKHSGEIILNQDDGLKRDNRGFFAVHVREQLRVLVWNAHPQSDPTKDEAFYLVTALAPESATAGGKEPIHPVVHLGQHLTGLQLSGYDGVIVTDFSVTDPTDIRALREYAAAGGGVLLLPGPSTVPAAINKAWMGGERALPAELKSLEVRTDQTVETLNPSSIKLSSLAAFRETNEMNIGAARFTRLISFAATPPDADEQILCKFSSGKPALIERRVGIGRILLSATSAGSGWSNFPFKAAFVPWFHQLTSYLAASSSSTRMLDIGMHAAARFPVSDARKPVKWRLPDRSERQLKTTLSPNGTLFTSPTTTEEGIYAASIGGSGSVETFAVNLPSQESDLAVFTPEQASIALGSAKARFVRADGDIPSLVREGRRGTEMWRPLVLAAGCLLLLEAMIAAIFGRRGAK